MNLVSVVNFLLIAGVIQGIGFNLVTIFIRKKFGGRVQKLSINAGFTCPNRDGSKGTRGCSYCNNNTFRPGYCAPEKSITQQIDEGVQFFSRKYPDTSGKLKVCSFFFPRIKYSPKLQFVLPMSSGTHSGRGILLLQEAIPTKDPVLLSSGLNKIVVTRLYSAQSNP